MGVFEVAVMGWSKCMNWKNWSTLWASDREFALEHKIIFMIYLQPVIKNFRKRALKKVDWTTLVTPER